MLAAAGDSDDSKYYVERRCGGETAKIARWSWALR